ncbi:MAG: hypothetical protein ACLP0J_08455 [Solirubrobacteraceae bacterium]
MFRFAASKIRSWWSAGTADILGADLLPPLDSRYPTGPSALDTGCRHPPALDSRYPHSKRAPLRFEYARRPGTVPPRPAVCISPVCTRQR